MTQNTAFMDDERCYVKIKFSYRPDESEEQ